MSISTFILAWIVAVTMMSSFSAIWSSLSGNEFREPRLLSHLFTKGRIPAFTTQQSLIGWIIHVVLGAVFLGAYEVLWNVTGVMRTLQWSLVFGAIIGIIGIVGWILMFKLHKDPPKIPFKQYYIHLFFAHLVFSVSAYLIYSFLN